jgi:hypothetical protein
MILILSSLCCTLFAAIYWSMRAQKGDAHLRPRIFCARGARPSRLAKKGRPFRLNNEACSCMQIADCKMLYGSLNTIIFPPNVRQIPPWVWGGGEVGRSGKTDDGVAILKGQCQE